MIFPIIMAVAFFGFIAGVRHGYNDKEQREVKVVCAEPRDPNVQTTDDKLNHRQGDGSKERQRRP